MSKLASKKSEKSSFVEPQLAQLVDAPPIGEKWVHEIKLDGYRTVVSLKKKKVIYLTRSGLDWTYKYHSLDKALQKLTCDSTTFDGEICLTDEKGATDFHGLVSALSSKGAKGLTYFIFDLLELNGHDTRELSLLDRKELLETLLKQKPSPELVYSKHVIGSGKKLLEDCCKHGLEGIISKDSTAPYSSGRGGAWLKTKCHLEQEFVIVGYALSEKRSGFRSLLLGVYDGKGKARKLRYCGRVGTGFDGDDLYTLSKKFKPLERKTSLFAQTIKLGNKWRAAGEVQWIEPILLAQVEFTGWTHDQQLRHPSFKGLREDKKATQVVKEKPKKLGTKKKASRKK